MLSTAPCLECGELISVDHEVEAGVAICEVCLREPAALRACVRVDPPRPLLGLSPHEGQERIVTRSMLVPMPGIAPGPTEEMICRLEPLSLCWLELSQSLENFLGQSIEQLVHQSVTLYVHHDDRDLAQEEFRQACERGERYDLVLRLKSRTGQWHYMRVSAQARYELNGRVNHIRCNLRDVTQSVRAEQELRRRTEKLIAANEQLRQANIELKKAQAQLVHSEKLAALGTLTAGIAHEINNPLAFAVNNVAVLQRDIEQLLKILSLHDRIDESLPASGPALETELARLKDEADVPYLEASLPRLLDSTYRGLTRIAQIVEKLRGFASLDRASVSEFDVNESIDQSLLMLNETISRLRITVDRHFGEPARMQGAAADINQVILDLLANAARAIEVAGRVDGRIVVATLPSGDEITIEVRDNGCGMSPDLVTKAFDPFFTTKPPGHGMGLGLSVSHGIVASHGGRIDVSSEAGQGSCFRVVLPTRHTLSDRPAVVGPGVHRTPL